MEKIYDIIIIGGGTAGMTAAIYGCRLGKRILIVEKNFFGGQIISTSEIENYPAFSSASGYAFATELHSQIEALNAEQVTDEVTSLQKEATSGCWRVICKKRLYSARAVIIASGTESRKLGLVGEDKLLGHGISHCATCDGALYKNRTVAVVGGGNTALEEALYLSLLCKKVYLIHRRSVFTGDLSLQHRIYDTDNIQLLLNSRIVALHGKDRLQSVELCACGQSSGKPSKENSNADSGCTANNDTKRNAAGASDNRLPAENMSSRQLENTGSNQLGNAINHSTEKLEIDALFVAIGQIPQNQPFADAVSLDPHGYIVAGENCHTNAPGVFAAGDCRTKDLRQLVTAASDGAVAATEAIKYLR